MKITTAQLKKIIKEEYDRVTPTRPGEKATEARLQFLTEEVMSELSWTPRVRKTVAVRKNDLLLAESYARLLLEEMSKDELAQATKTIDKLRAIKSAVPKKAEDLSVAILEAAKDINAFVGGSFRSAQKTGKLASFFGIKSQENPLLKGLTLLNSLESAFKLLPNILKNNIEEYDEDSEKSPLDQAGSDPRVSDTLKSSLAKAMTPQGVYSKLAQFFGGGDVPYVKSVDALVSSILSSKAKEVKALTDAVLGGPRTDDLSNAVQKQMRGGGEASQGSQEPPSPQEVSAEKKEAETLEDAIKSVSKSTQANIDKIDEPQVKEAISKAQEDIKAALKPAIATALRASLEGLTKNGYQEPDAKIVARSYTLSALLSSLADIYNLS